MINKSCATSLSKLRRYLTYSIRSRIASGAKKKREPDEECSKAEYIHMCEYVKSNKEGS
jgi:hypothetical protein